MQTLTLQIPDSEYLLFLAEMEKFKGIKIQAETVEGLVFDLKVEIQQAVKEVNMVKNGKSKARPARELLNEL